MTQKHHTLSKPKSTLSIFFAAGGGISLILAAVVMFATALSWASFRDAARLDAQGVQTVGYVVDKQVQTRRRTNGGGTTTRYYVMIVFDADGVQFKHRDNVSSTAYQNTQIGDPVTIWYWPEDPNIAERERGETEQFARIAQKSALFVGIAALVALWWLGQRAVKAVLARRFGVRTTAKVIDVVEHRHKGRKTGKGHMVFVTKNGLRGKSFGHWLSRLHSIGIGASLTVYHRKGDVFWEGDLGPRILPRSSVPTVSNDL